MPKHKRTNDIPPVSPDNRKFLDLIRHAHLDGTLSRDCLSAMITSTGEKATRWREGWFDSARSFIEEINQLGVNGVDVDALLKKATSSDIPPPPKPDPREEELKFMQELGKLVASQLHVVSDHAFFAEGALAVMEQALNALESPSTQRKDVRDSWTGDLVLGEALFAQTINYLAIGGWHTEGLINKLTQPSRPETAFRQNIEIGPQKKHG